MDGVRFQNSIGGKRCQDDFFGRSKGDREFVSISTLGTPPPECVRGPDSIGKLGGSIRRNAVHLVVLARVFGHADADLIADLDGLDRSMLNLH